MVTGIRSHPGAGNSVSKDPVPGTPGSIFLLCPAGPVAGRHVPETGCRFEMPPGGMYSPVIAVAKPGAHVLVT